MDFTYTTFEFDDIFEIATSNDNPNRDLHTPEPYLPQALISGTDVTLSGLMTTLDIIF